MNNIFKVIWNKQLARFVVVSELARGFCKTSSSSPRTNRVTAFSEMGKFPVSALAFIISATLPAAFAEEITVHTFSPESDFQQVVTGTDNLLTGSFTSIQRGGLGYVKMALGEARDKGLLTAESAKWIDYNIVRIGSQTRSINYIDPVTGNTESMRVYDSNDMQSEPAKDFKTTISVAVGKNGQYVDKNFYEIGPGSSLDVNVGQQGAGWAKSSDNLLNAILKSSDQTQNKASIFHVLSSASQAAALNYRSKTIVSLGNTESNIKNVNNPTTWMGVDDFVGEFNSVIGKQNVKTLDDFKAYNNALIKALQTPESQGGVRLTEQEYVNELNKARGSLMHPIYANMDSIADDDATRAFVNSRAVSYIHADGDAATVTVQSGANIQMVDSDATLVNLENGATLINEGTLGTAGNTFHEAYVITAHHNSVVENHGVIDAGTNPDMVDFFVDGAKGVALGHQSGVMADGSAVVNNHSDGVLNLASRGNYQGNLGIWLKGNAVLNNDGVINIAASQEAAQIFSDYSNIGIEAQHSTVMNNRGTVYIGRAAQRTPDEAVADLDIKQPSIGVHIYGSATYNGFDDSSIVIGSKTQNAVAIDIGGNASLNQRGLIRINGNIPGKEVAENIGIVARSGTQASKVVNYGTIELNGLNATAIVVEEGGNITHAGTIDVNGGLDPQSGYANYGIRASGQSARAIVSGGINLKGDGAICVYVKNKGQVDILDTGAVNFVEGQKQTGYFIFGQDSIVNNGATGSQDVATANSTLYRIDGGATFNASLLKSASLKASGTDSTLIRTTGTGSSMHTGALTLNVAGSGATGVRVEGGATGTIDAATQIDISGNGATAGIVDGRYFKADGTEDTGKKGESGLLSEATLTTANTARNALGYKVLAGGTLIHRGEINFTQAGSTGVLVDGGTLENQKTIVANGVAVDIQGAGSAVTNTGTVTATDGTAAYRVGNGASLTLGGAGTTTAQGSAHGIQLAAGAKALNISNATITMAANGSGNAIENTAEISGIQLTDTTINVGGGAGVRTGATLAAQNSGTINVDGSGTGILFQRANGAETNGDFDLSASQALVVNVNSAQGKGVVTHTQGAVKNGVSVNVKHDDGAAALEVQGGTASVIQSGILTSTSMRSAVVDLQHAASLKTLTNSGAILARDAQQVAIQADANAGGIDFTNEAGGVIRGKVNLEAGNNRITLQRESQATDIFTLAGNDLYRLQNIDEKDSALFTSLNAGHGDDTLLFDNAKYILHDAAALNGFEHIQLTNSSTLTLDNVGLALGDEKNDVAGTGYRIDAHSQLAVRANSEHNFASHLSGTGVLSADLGSENNAFNFTANNAGDGFAGTVALTNSRFLLSADNTRALAAATLKTGAGNITTVAKGAQRIGGLAFDGGTIKFETKTLGQATADSFIQAEKTLDIAGKGTVQVQINPVLNAPVLPNNALNLLAQDDMQTGLKLAGVNGQAQGSAGNLTLIDQQGKVITSAVSASVEQGGITAAQATYDYRLTGGERSDGLYINYGLKTLDLLTQGANALALNASGQSGAGADLSARVTGSGDLAIATEKGSTVSLSNLDNDYTGVTDVRSGALRLANDNVLGNSSELRQAGETRVDMNGHRQTVGALNTAAAAVTDINGGELTLSHGGTVDGFLRGAGELNIAGGVLRLTGANAELTATTRIASGAQAVINSGAGLGNGAIANAGTLTVTSAKGQIANNLSGNGLVSVQQASDVALTGQNSGFSGQFAIEKGSHLTAASQAALGASSLSDAGLLTLAAADTWQLNNHITGAGDVQKTGGGTVTLLQNAAQFTGVTDVQQGALMLGSASAETTLASSRVEVSEGAVFGGFGGTAGDVNNRGTLTVGQSAAMKARLLAAAEQPAVFTVGGNLVNSNALVIGHPGSSRVGNQLHVAGDYQGNGGHIYFNTALGGDNSATDRMIIDGATSGTSAVSVANAGGSGAKTLNGIELIHVGGDSAGEFTQAGRIAAGAYDYTLIRGTGSNAGNWYLVSGKSDPTPVPDPGPGPKPQPVPDTRPEAGAYTANIAAANTLFVNRLHDRLGETHYVDALTGEARVTSLWLRNVGGHNRFKDASGQLSTQANRYVMQLGGDIAQWSSSARDRFHLGVMGGYANQKSHTRNQRNGYRADGSIDGYSVGLYGTWLQDNDEKTGAYVDTWLQYGWFNNHINSDVTQESYKSRGLTGSVETGYTWKLGERDTRTAFYIQPKAQAVWMGVKSDDVKEKGTGTRVSSEGDGNLQTRLGVRGFIKGHSGLDDGKQRTFEPFVEANWLHNTRAFGVRMNGVRVDQAGSRNIGEVKVGVEGQLNPRVNLWGNVAQQVGDKGYSDTSAMFGVKVNF